MSAPETFKPSAVTVALHAAAQDLARLRHAGGKPTTPGIESGGPAATPAADDTGVVLIRGDTVKLEPVRWLWHGFLPTGRLTILGGKPGCGKTTLAMTMAATVTRGARWPDGAACEQGDVIVWSGEDDRSLLAGRLAAAGAEMRRIHFVAGASDGEPFDPSRDVPDLMAKAAMLPALRLVVLDPVVSAVAGDSHKNAEVRRGLQPVVDLAHATGCAVLGITHFSKGTAGREPMERVTGSIAFAALARLVLVAADAKAEPGEQEDGGDEPRRVLLRAKSNIGPSKGGFAYRVEQIEVQPGIEGQRVRWLEALEGSARELLAEAEAQPEAAGDDAADVDGFLRGLLADGPVPAKSVFSDASGAGYSRDQLQRAARRLGVERRKDGMAGGWIWAFAGLAEGGTAAPKMVKVAPLCVPPSSPPSGPSVPPSAATNTPADDAEVI